MRQKKRLDFTDHLLPTYEGQLLSDHGVHGTGGDEWVEERRRTAAPDTRVSWWRSPASPWDGSAAPVGDGDGDDGQRLSRTSSDRGRGRQPAAVEDELRPGTGTAAGTFEDELRPRTATEGCRGRLPVGDGDEFGRRGRPVAGVLGRRRLGVGSGSAQEIRVGSLDLTDGTRAKRKEKRGTNRGVKDTWAEHPRRHDTSQLQMARPRRRHSGPQTRHTNPQMV